MRTQVISALIGVVVLAYIPLLLFLCGVARSSEVEELAKSEDDDGTNV